MRKTPPRKPVVVYDDHIDIWFSSDPDAPMGYNMLFEMFNARQPITPQLQEYRMRGKIWRIAAQIRDLPKEGHRVVSIRLSGGLRDRIGRRQMREFLVYIRTHTGVLAP